MSLPLLGVAVGLKGFAEIRDWIVEPGRTIEIQDFVYSDVIAGDLTDVVARWRAALADHRGVRGLHGPFFGLDISNPDREIRAVIQRRFLAALGAAEALDARYMVIHSPFTYWHHLNRRNFTDVAASMTEAAADCLAPVLARAAAIGCTLMLENIDDADPTMRVDFVRTVGHDRLRTSIDTGHADLAHGRYDAPPVVDFIAAAGDSLGHVHLQDVDGYADRHWHPGDGRIAWRPVFDAIARLAERPHLILEVRGDLPRLPDTVARLTAAGLAR